MEIKRLIEESKWRTPNGIGEALHKKADNGKSPNAASLATYVLRLTTKDDRDWWLRPSSAPYRRALCDLLGETELDLFPEADNRTPASPFAASEWPAMRPFDPTEPPVDVGVLDVSTTWRAVGEQPPAPGLLEYLLSGLKAPRWVCVPAGGGKEFARALLAAKGLKTARVSYLRELAALPKADLSDATVLIDDEAPDTDATWVDQLKDVEGLVVLAPFPLPRRDSEEHHSSPWVRATWRGNSEGRRSLIEWAAGRVRGDSLLTDDAMNVAAWLDRIDPQASNVGTPAAILWVCARVHELGLPKCKSLGLLGLFAPYLDSVSKKVEARSPEGAQWLRDRGVRVVEALLAGRVNAMDLRGWNVATADRWTTTLPADLQPSPLTPRDLEELAGLQNPQKRKEKMQSVMTKMAVRSAGEAVDRLKQAGLLVASGAGLLALEPSWYVHAWTMRWLQDRIAGTSLEWGHLSFDPGRRETVDRALDWAVARPQVLRALIDRLPAEPRCPDEVGATEAAFAAVARALSNQQKPGVPHAHLHKLWLAQVHCCIWRFDGPHTPIPLSRRGSADAWLDEPTWHRDCWTWSFELPAPAAQVPEFMIWLFPGWTKPPMSTLPRQFSIREREGGPLFYYLVHMFSQDPAARPPENALSEVWTAWVYAVLARGERPSDIREDHILWDLIARLIGPAEGEFDSLRWGQGRELVGLVAEHAKKGEAAWHLTQDDYPNLRALFLACVDGALAVEVAERSGLNSHAVLQFAARVPHRAHLALVEWAAATDPKSWTHGGRDDVNKLGDDAVGWLARHFAEENWDYMRSWTLRDPAGALEWLLGVRLKSNAASSVMSNLPPALELQLLEWIEAQAQDERPDNVFWWAAFAIERRPDLADRLLPLMRFAVADPIAS